MKREITVALAGNPNAGKTTIFNAITGARQHVGNWPGVTVEKKEGTLTHQDLTVHVVDLSGTYSLRVLSEDEIVARDFLLDGGVDVVVCFVDASNLERNLYLVMQVKEMGVKVVLDLNMIDVVGARGIHIDDDRLSRTLNTPVIPTNGSKGQGIKALLDKVRDVALLPRTNGSIPLVNYGADAEAQISKIEAQLRQSDVIEEKRSLRWLAIKLLEHDTDVEERFKNCISTNGLQEQITGSRHYPEIIYGDSPDIMFADSRYGFISGVMKQTTRVDGGDRVHVSERIDRILTNRLLGPLVLLAVLYGMFQFTFVGSEPLVAYFEAFFAWLGESASKTIPEGLFQSLVVSGIIAGVGGVLSFTPLIAFMFLAITIVEDSGYMARIAFMLDRVLRAFGLHGVQSWRSSSREG